MKLNADEINFLYNSSCRIAISKLQAQREKPGKYLTRPDEMIRKTWDPAFKLLVKTIEANKHIFTSNHLSLFEIGVGTGYFLFKVEHSLEWIKTSGMDIPERDRNEFHLMRRMLGIDKRIEAGGIYKPEAPISALQNDIVFICLPVFELNWRTREWREFLSSIFMNQESKTKMLIFIANSSRDRDYFVVDDSRAYQGICEAFVATKSVLILKKFS